MKKLVTLITGLFILFTASKSIAQLTIATVPGSYSDRTFSSSDYTTMNSLSATIKGMAKVDLHSSTVLILLKRRLIGLMALGTVVFASKLRLV